MLSFRKANYKDIEHIAALHALSWQQNYRGVFSDDFLDTKVVDERLLVWEKRMKNPAKNQFVYVAVDDALLVGFVCIYLDYDATYGTLVDNLHVISEYSGQRIGLELMLKVFQEIRQRNAINVFMGAVNQYQSD